MIYALLIGGAFLALILISVFRTAALNSDPRQQALAQTMLAAIEEGRADRAAGSRVTHRSRNGGPIERVSGDPRPFAFAWQEDVVPFFCGIYGLLTASQRQTRAAHALSMIKPMLTSDEYEVLRKGYCRTLPTYCDDLTTPGRMG